MRETKIVKPSFNGSASNSSSKIDAIKELLFGEEINVYDQQLELLKQDVLNKKAELDKLIQEVKKDLNKSIDDLGTDVNKKLNNLEQKFEKRATTLDEKKVDKKMLGSMLVKLGEKISQ